MSDIYTHYDARGDGEHACGGDDDCTSIEREPECVEALAHVWTREGTGGCGSNPGVWSLGGTAFRFVARCRICGAERTVLDPGSQRNPGECDQVAYAADVYEPEADALTRARRNRRRRQRAAAARAARLDAEQITRCERRLA